MSSAHPTRRRGARTTGAPSNLHEIAERHAPLVVLDEHEHLFPVAAEAFIAECELVWVEGPGNVGVEPTPLNAAKLGAGSGDPYASVWHPGGTEAVLANFHTRPFDTSDRQPAGLPVDRGWALRLKDPDAVTGTPSTSSDPGVYEGSPAYYEWTPTKDGSFITYWFCYAGSALPRKIAEVAGYLPGGRRSTRRGRGVNEEEFDFLAALASAHPDLYREATRAQRPGATRRGWTDPIEDAARFLNDVITDKAPALWDARDNPHHLCHQGDWEGVSLELDPTDSLGEAVSMVTFQHGKATPVRDVEWVDGRACVYSARGSHATLGSPPARWTGSGDTCTAGQTWKTWEKPGVLNAEEQAWYGFGGAWGAAGNCGDLTGPLGPSLWKRPTGVLGSDT